MPQAFIFIGRSGCGKGTQADLFRKYIENKSGLPTLYVESGEYFRDFISKSGFSNKLSREIYESGERQPSFLACFMWTKKFIEDYNGGQNIIIDGAPRALTEAQIMKTALDFFRLKKTAVFHMDVSRDWSKKRLFERKRSDDIDPKEVEKRLDWFDNDTVPAIDFFEKSADFYVVKINGEQSIDDVHKEIVSKTEPLI